MKTKIITSLVVPISLLSSCNEKTESKIESPQTENTQSSKHSEKQAKTTELVQEGQLTPAEQLANIKGFKISLEPNGRRAEALDVELIQEVRDILENKHQTIYKTKNDTWILEFDRYKKGIEKQPADRGDSEYSLARFYECPDLQVRILKYPITEADKLNGIDWKAQVFLQFHTFRNFEYSSEKKSFTPEKWKAFNTLPFYNLHAVLTKEKLHVKGGGMARMRIRGKEFQTFLKVNTKIADQITSDSVK